MRKGAVILLAALVLAAISCTDSFKSGTGNPVPSCVKKKIIHASDNAIAWLPERGDATDNTRIFYKLPAQVGNADARLHTLTKKAGINKHVSFHVARHTFATLTLTYGADLYTVSKLLGHANMRTTQIYAKIVDENKRKAVNLIPAP